jgi:hypothetical protein
MIKTVSALKFTFGDPRDFISGIRLKRMNGPGKPYDLRALAVIWSIDRQNHSM